MVDGIGKGGEEALRERRVVGMRQVEGQRELARPQHGVGKVGFEAVFLVPVVGDDGRGLELRPLQQLLEPVVLDEKTIGGVGIHIVDEKSVG